MSRMRRPLAMTRDCEIIRGVNVRMAILQGVGQLQGYDRSRWREITIRCISLVPS